VGARWWAGAGLILGCSIYPQIDWLLVQFYAFGGHALAALLYWLRPYVAYRWIVRRRFLKSLQASRIEVAELAGDDRPGDARSFSTCARGTHRKLDARMIPARSRSTFDDLERPLAQISADRDVVVYCACPNDATGGQGGDSAQAARHTPCASTAGGIDAGPAPDS